MGERIIGHENVLDFFAKVVKNGNLSHAYCFIGPETVGKRTVSEKIAVDLLQTTKEKLYTHPDFILIKQEFSEKTEKTNKDIIIEQIRNLRQYLARHAYLGGYKVAIIDEAEKMNDKAANALLKTLEEPTAKTVLFIITKDEEQLPKTIVSRCQLIYFHPVAREAIAGWLRESGNSVEAEEIARWSLGLPGRAKQWQEDKDFFKGYKKEAERFLKLAGKDFFEKLKLVDDLFKENTDVIANREKLCDILDIWQLLSRDYYLNNIGLQNLSAHTDEKAMACENLKTERQIRRARKFLTQNINPRLLIENILLTLP